MTAPVVKVELSLNGANWKSAPGGGAYFTGGTVTEADGYRTHTFTSSGTLTCVTAGDVEYLVVAGGGGTDTDQANGGGGGGGVLNSDLSGALSISTVQTITVGAGGYNSALPSTKDGQPSSIGSLVVASGGGGSGNNDSRNGRDGGSGGGGHSSQLGQVDSGLGGLGISGQGYDGGDGGYSDTGGRTGGGGGGAAEEGAPGTPNPDFPSDPRVAGDGGDGLEWPTGSGDYYGGGGGGGLRGTGTPGLGGLGGGGNGGTPTVVQEAGVDGTGGGCGGPGFGAAAGPSTGGSGIVIIRYLNSGSPAVSWTDITAYVLFTAGIQITRGRAGARDEVRAGTCTFTIQDKTRRFDPENASGPYYGFLNPGVPVRVTVTHNSIVYERFYGFVEDFPQTATDPADKRVLIPIQAIDLFGMLALARQTNSVMGNAILALDPVGYWPLTEPANSTTVEDRGSGLNHGTVFDEPTFGETALAPGLGTSVLFDGDNDRIDISRSLLWDPSSAWAVVAVIRTSTPAEASSAHPIFMQVQGNASADIAALFVNTAGKVERYQFRSGAGFDYIHPTVVTDGDPHLIIGSRDPIGSDYGVAVDSAVLSTTTTTAATQSGNGTAIGGTPFAGRDYTDNQFAGAISQVAAWDNALTLTQRETLVTAYAALDGQTTDERIGYLLDQLGFPTAERTFTTGYTTLGAADIEGQFTLDLIRRVEQSEQGRFFIARDGKATFHARYHGQLVETASSATFSDDGADVAYSNVEVNRARQYIYNKITSTADGLSPVTVSDATSIEAYGERDLSVDAPLLPTASQQQALAEYILSLYKDPQPRVTGMAIPIHKNWTTWVPIVLPLEQGDRVTFERQPVNTGSAMSWAQTLEGYSERFDSKSWTWTPSLSPAQPVTFCVWGGSAVDANEWGTGLWGY